MLDHDRAPTPNHRRKERQTKSSYIHVARFWSLLQCESSLQGRCTAYVETTGSFQARSMKFLKQPSQVRPGSSAMNSFAKVLLSQPNGTTPSGVLCSCRGST